MKINSTYKGLVVAAALIGSGAVGVQYVNMNDALTRVIDGDTIVINGRTHVRLWGIDAPELGQKCQRQNAALAFKLEWACGRSAKSYLESFFALKNVKLQCDRKGSDVHGRRLAICWAINSKGERHDIGKSLVAAGYALDYKLYSGGYYAHDQAYAEKHQLGVWSGAFEFPSDYRHRTDQ